MKKVISGKLYDTETAKKLASYCNNRSDFSRCTETLYRKRTGEYFLHGVGGPSSAYAHAVDYNSWSGGEKIIPFTEEKAREWAEDRLDGDDYEAIFGEVTEEPADRMISLQVPAEMDDALTDAAKQAGVSKSALIRDMITAALAK